MPAVAVVGCAVGAAAYFVRLCLQKLHTDLLVTTRAPLHNGEKSGFGARAVSGPPPVRYTSLVSPTTIVVDDEALYCLVQVVHAQLHPNMLKMYAAGKTDLQQSAVTHEKVEEYKVH